jgi:hypothetical protein
MSHEMPVTTKAQLDAESEDCVNSLKPQNTTSLAKLRNLLKASTFLLGLFLLPAEPDRTKVAGSRSGGLFSLPSGVRIVIHGVAFDTFDLCPTFRIDNIPSNPTTESRAPNEEADPGNGFIRSSP